jgi:hypothetical protein
VRAVDAGLPGDRPEVHPPRPYFVHAPYAMASSLLIESAAHALDRPRSFARRLRRASGQATRQPSTRWCWRPQGCGSQRAERPVRKGVRARLAANVRQDKDGETLLLGRVMAPLGDPKTHTF